MMHNRRLVTLRVVGMAVLLICLWALGISASDGNAAAGDANTPPAASAAKPSASASEQINTLKEQMVLQQRQIEQMQKALEEQKRLLDQLTKPAPATEQAAQPAPATKAAATAQPVRSATVVQQSSSPHASGLGDVASTTPMIPQPQKKVEDASILGMGPAAGAKGPETDNASPLTFHIGEATITPVGFMDFTSIYRNHDTNGSIASNFGNYPYPSTTAYAPNLSEFRLSTENSRIGFRVDASVKGAHVMGYMEADFHGNNATTVAVSTNANTLRERLYWVDLNTGKFEVLGGQTWSLITPGRSGISPLPADIFYSQDIDVNYQLGLVFGRIPELRFVYHPTKTLALAVALDSPDQYLGGNAGSATIVLPAYLNSSTTYTGELDNGSAGNTLSTPNVAPDTIAKIAWDPSKHFHGEIGGILREFKVYNPGEGVVASGGSLPANPNPIAGSTYQARGGGGFVNLSVEPIKGLRFLTNNFWGDGGGRYIFGQAPDLIARADGTISLLKSGSTVSGVELTEKNTFLYSYYGGVYVARDAAFDTDGATLIGYGYRGSANSQNRSNQEITFGFNQTIWKNAKYGALNFMGQYSYFMREPWYVASGKPGQATIDMLFFNLRYTLPGSAPTMGK